MDFYSKVLEACLDTTHDSPAWITDELGTVIASNLKTHDLNLTEIDLSEPIIRLNDKKYKYVCHELNHGTGCHLHELKDQNEVYVQLQKSITALEARINKNKNSIKI